MPATLTNASIDFVTDHRAITKNNHTGRFACDCVSLQDDGNQNTQLVSTNGCVLAVIDRPDWLDENGVGPCSTLIPHASLPTTRGLREVTVTHDDKGEVIVINQKGKIEAPREGTFPPIQQLFIREDKVKASITVRVDMLRALLDALTPVNEPEATVTIGISDIRTKPAVITSKSGIGLIMPVDTTWDHGIDGLNDRIDRAEAICKATH
jgi:hypothetical protein